MRPSSVSCSCPVPVSPGAWGRAPGRYWAYSSHEPAFSSCCVSGTENSRSLWGRYFLGICPGLGTGDVVVTEPLGPPGTGGVGGAENPPGHPGIWSICGPSCHSGMLREAMGERVSRDRQKADKGSRPCPLSAGGLGAEAEVRAVPVKPPRGLLPCVNILPWGLCAGCALCPPLPCSSLRRLLLPSYPSAQRFPPGRSPLTTLAKCPSPLAQMIFSFIQLKLPEIVTHGVVLSS